MSATNASSSYFHALQMRLEKRFSQRLPVPGQLPVRPDHRAGQLPERLSARSKSVPPISIARIASSPASATNCRSARASRCSARRPGSSGAVLDRVVGGWVINGIYSYESGGPAGSWGDMIYLGGPLNCDPEQRGPYVRHHAVQPQHGAADSPTTCAPSPRASPTCACRRPITSTPRSSRTRASRSASPCSTARSSSTRSITRYSTGRNLTPTSSAFGTISGVYNLERHIQMALRLTF